MHFKLDFFKISLLFFRNLPHVYVNIEFFIKGLNRQQNFLSLVLMVEFFQIFRASNYVIQFTHGLYHVVEWSQEIIFIISKISILALELCKKLQVLEISLNRLRDLYQSIPRDGFSRKKIFSECEVMCDYIESRFLEIRRLRVENQRFLTQDL